MTPEQLSTFAEIRRLLADGYHKARYLDTCHKSSDGYCEVYYPTAYSDEEGCGGTVAKGLMIYSYVLGPSRQHYFHHGSGRSNYCTFYSADPFKTALGEVRKWIAEMDATLAEENITVPPLALDERPLEPIKAPQEEGVQ